MLRKAGTGVLVLGLLVLTGCSNPYTPAGHEGYVFERPRIFGKGGFRGRVDGPGNYGVSLFRNEVINIDIRPTTYNFEEKANQRDIAQRDAEIRIEEAKGIAEAQGIINSTLTSNYLQHEAIQAQLRMAESPNHTTVYIPVGHNGMPLVYTPK